MGWITIRRAASVDRNLSAIQEQRTASVSDSLGFAVLFTSDNHKSHTHFFGNHVAGVFITLVYTFVRKFPKIEVKAKGRVTLNRDTCCINVTSNCTFDVH